MGKRSYFDVTKSRQEAIQEKLLGELRCSRELPDALADACHEHATRFLEELPEASKVACRKGCSYCCHQPATVFAFEAIRIAHALSVSLSDHQLKALKKKMKARVNGLRGASVRKNVESRTACPLLGPEGQCSIYADRPLTCRMAHSFAVRRCRLSFEKGRVEISIPISLEWLSGISGIIEAAFEQLPQKFQLDGNLYELCSAVLKALDDPRAELKWAQGNLSVFANCIKDDT